MSLGIPSPHLTQRSQHCWCALAALLHDIGKPATRTDLNGKVQFIGHQDVGARFARNIMRRLKYGNSDINAVAIMVARHMDLKIGGPDASGLRDRHLRLFINRCGDLLDDVLNVIHADNVSHAPQHSMPDQIQHIRRRIAHWDLDRLIRPDLPVDGHDLLDLGLSGPQIGQVLERITKRYVEHDGIDRKDGFADRQTHGHIVVLRRLIAILRSRHGSMYPSLDIWLCHLYCRILLRWWREAKKDHKAKAVSGDSTRSEASGLPENALHRFLPAVQRWFTSEIGEPSPPQVQAWPHISSGENTLIHAPTGSGKTLAAFLASINRLFSSVKPGQKRKGVETLIHLTSQGSQ